MAYRTEIEKLEQRYAENPKQWFAALADAYRKQGEVDLAIEYVRGGIEDRPNYASAHIVLGRCFLDKNMDDDAACAFEQVLELDAENIVALKSLEEIAERKGDVGGARQWLNRLLEVDPMNDEAHESLARLELQEVKEPEPEVVEPVPAPAAEEIRVESEESVEDVSVDSTPPDLTVSEDVVDASSVEVEPMMLDAMMPMDDESVPADEEPEAAIEPIEIETEDVDASSLFSAVSADPEFSAADENAVAAIEPIEIETEESDASSLLAGVSEDSDSVFVDETAAAAIGSIELERPDADANSLLANIPEGADLLVEEEQPAAAIEPIELDTADTDTKSWLADISEEGEPLGAPNMAVADIGPIELETSESDASSLVADIPGEVEPFVAFENAVVELEPIELETAEDDFSSSLEDIPEEIELAVEDEATEEDTGAEVESVELETVEDEFGASLDDVPEEIELAAEDEVTGEELEAAVESVDTEAVEAIAEPVVDVEDAEDIADLEKPPIDEEALPRFSVPPTKEVDAVDLEALRAADELVRRPTVEREVVDEAVADDPIEPSAEAEDLAEVTAEVEDIAEATSELEVDEEQGDVVELTDEPIYGLTEETPRTTEIDAVELEKLRAADALVAGSTVEALLPDGVEEDAENDALPLIMPEEVGGAEADTEAEPEPVVTETMAEVYARQGLLEQAREIYEVLVMQHADDSRLRARLDELNEQANSAIQETRQSRFSVSATGGESTVSYLQRIFTYESEVGAEAYTADVATAEPDVTLDSESEMALTPLEEAFADDPPEAPGEPTVVAADEVNLVSVFDGGAPEPVSTDQSPDGSDQDSEESGDEDGVSFDEFYGSEPRPSLSEANGTASDDDPSDDDDNFKDWLRGLKT